MKKKFLFNSFFLFLLGALSSLSIPPLNLFFINFFTFSVFFIFLFKNKNLKFQKKLFFYYGWIFGFGYFLTNIYWITISLTFDQNFIYLIPISIILVPAFLSLFYGVVSLIFYLLKLKNLVSNFLLFSLLFGIIEFIRGNIFTGFPWNLIIFSLSESLNFISFLSVIGTYSFNLLIISFFSAPAIYILRKSKKDVVISILFLSMPILFFSYSYFYKQNFFNNEIKKNPYTIRIIGSNISLDRFYENVRVDKIIKELIEISSPDKAKKTIFLWPEGILPDIYQDELFLYRDLFSNFNENHLIGLGITSRSFNSKNYKYFNSFSIFDNNLNLIDNYNKINLVPFGEFLPFEQNLNKIGLKTITKNIQPFSKGASRKVMTIDYNNQQLKFLPLICYEIIYSGKLTKNFNFDYILNISEDGWFGKSIGPKQHFSHTIFRAIENGKYILRSSNNGMAAIINPLGEIEQKIDFGKNGYIDFNEIRDLGPTFFSKYGNKIFLFVILLYIFLIFSFNRFLDE